MDAKLMLSICDLIEAIKDVLPIKAIEINKEHRKGNLQYFCQLKVTWNLNNDPADLNLSRESIIQISRKALEEVDGYTAPQKELSKDFFKALIESHYSKFNSGPHSKQEQSEIGVVSITTLNGDVNAYSAFKIKSLNYCL
jgi:hypothetical protein